MTKNVLLTFKITSTDVE